MYKIRSLFLKDITLSEYGNVCIIVDINNRPITQLMETWILSFHKRQTSLSQENIDKEVECMTIACMLGLFNDSV